MEHSLKYITFKSMKQVLTNTKEQECLNALLDHIRIKLEIRNKRNFTHDTNAKDGTMYHIFFLFFFFTFYFLEKSFRCPGWPHTYYVAQDGPKLPIPCS